MHNVTCIHANMGPWVQGWYFSVLGAYAYRMLHFAITMYTKGHSHSPLYQENVYNLMTNNVFSCNIFIHLSYL